MSHDINSVAMHLSHRPTVLLHLKQSLPVLFLVQFTAIRHCFSVLAFVCESILHLRNPNRFASIGQVHDAFITKKNMIHLFTLFSLLSFEGNCEESLLSKKCAGCSLGEILVQYSWLNTNGSAQVNKTFIE